MNYYQHHIGDYLRDTAHLSIIEDGCYRRLMDVYYTREKPFPDDMPAICRLARAKTKEERAAIETVLNEFFILRADGWHQSRCDEEILGYQNKAEANRENGKKGGRPKPKNNPEQTKEEPTQNHGGYFSKPKDNLNQEPLTSNQEPIPKRERVETPRATRFGLDAIPPEWELFCRESRHDLDPKKTFDRFADYWRAKPGRDGTKLDWFATWRNWVRNEKGKSHAVSVTGSTGPLSKARQREIENQRVLANFIARNQEAETRLRSSGAQPVCDGDLLPEPGTDRPENASLARSGE